MAFRHILVPVYFVSVICLPPAWYQGAAANISVLSEQFRWDGIEPNNTDLVFVLDRSGSVGAANFEIETGFVQSFLNYFDVMPNATRVAIITFSDTAEVAVDFLKEPGNKCILAKHIADLQYFNPRATNTGAGLQAAAEVFRNARPDSRKILVLVTDGLATMGDDPAEEAKQLRSAGVLIFVFGIGRTLKKSLITLVESPDHVFECNTFQEFKHIYDTDRSEHRWNLEDKPRDCDRLCKSPYRGQPDDPGCCNSNAICACSLITGHTGCLCGPGFYGQGGHGQCTPCRPGTYKSTYDKVPCLQCPTNSSTATAGSKSIKDCVCKKGYKGDPAAGDPCTPVTCPPLQAPPHGRLLPDCEVSVNSVCDFECEDGYEIANPDASESRTCESDGTWSGETTVCVPVRCDEPPELKNGYITGCDGQRNVSARCKLHCDHGYELHGESVRVCTDQKYWSGGEAYCIPVRCPHPPRVENGRELGIIKKNTTYKFNDFFQPECPTGFKLEGPSFLTCDASGHWQSPSGETFSTMKCVDTEPPVIRCPNDVKVATELRHNLGIAEWKSPTWKDNSEKILAIEQSPDNLKSPAVLPIGKITITYTVTDHARLHARCNFTVEVVDKEEPLVTSCPADIEVNTAELQALVTWDEPQFTDNSQQDIHIYKSHAPGTYFNHGTQEVVYRACDTSRNCGYCRFKVTVSNTQCPSYPAPLNGALSCDEDVYVQFCQVLCDSRYDFAETPADLYICDKDRKWQTVPEGMSVPWPDCTVLFPPSGVRKQISAHYYTGDCRDERIQAYIKSLFQLNYDRLKSNLRLCTGGAECKLDNVKVTCGNTTEILPATGSSGRLKRSLDTEFLQDPNSIAEVDADFILELRGNGTTGNSTEELLNTAEEMLGAIGEIDDSALAEVIGKENVSFHMNLLDVSFSEAVLICARGQTLNGETCAVCPIGTFHNVNDDICSPCPSGTYQDEDGSVACKPCPEGTLTATPKSKSPDECRRVCAEGTFSSTGMETCVACPRGTFQNRTMQTHCERCPSGTTTEAAGSIYSEDCKRYCDPGTYSETGLAPCAPCPRGFYQEHHGQKTCEECRIPTTNLQEGSTSSFDCVEVDHCAPNPCGDEACHNTQHGFFCSTAGGIPSNI